jgi:hypothetical protein
VGDYDTLQILLLPTDKSLVEYSVLYADVTSVTPIGLPQRGRCYIRMLQVLRTSVRCLLFSGVTGYWLFAGVMGY